jgi:hypothetical protein
MSSQPSTQTPHWDYRGQLVYVGEGNAPHREGTIEIAAGVFALVRLHVVGSGQQSTQQVLS